MLRYLRGASEVLVGDICPYTMPWCKTRDSTIDINCVHRLSLKLWRKQARQGVKKPVLAMVLVALFWPMISALRALIRTCKYGGYAARECGVSRWRQYMQQIYFANRYNLSSRWYYIFMLFNRANAKMAGDFVTDQELGPLLRELHRGVDWARVDNKVKLFEHCQRHGLAAPPVYVAFKKGKATQWFVAHEGELPRCDLVLKLTADYGGRGFERWEYVSQSDAWQFEQRALTQEQLLDHGCQTSRQGACMLQRCLDNHSALAGHSRGGLCTVRVMTYRLLSGEIGVGFVRFRMPTGSSDVDNYRAGGLHATVNLTNGVVGPAKSYVPGSCLVHEHPDTKAQISGMPLPYWSQTLDLCCRAHQSLPGFVFIGWDVALTDQGPQLLEGNTMWGTPDDIPLGQTAFTQCTRCRLQKQE